MCEGPVVRAHSVRRASDLRSIAERGHVIQFQADARTLRRTRGKPEARLIGINDASTFHGFCRKHDTATFRPIEASPFAATSEQCFLLLYRAWCREAYTKEAAARAAEMLRELDKGRPFIEQLGIQTSVNAHITGVALGVRDVRHYKRIVDDALLVGDFTCVNSMVFEFGGTLPVVCSGAFFPYFDVEGRPLQIFDPERTLEPLAITLLNDAGIGYAVFSWLASAADTPRAFMTAVERCDSLSNVIVRVALLSIENVFVSPGWWASLLEDQRIDISGRFADNVDPYVDLRSDDLIPTVPALLDMGVARPVLA